jgi:ABC-type nitrate/sulfonate/bicarbonate transport system substrate-binding protein
VSPPATLFARKAGMNFLVNLSDLKIEYQGSTFASRRSLMKNYPNLTLRTARALVRGIHFFKTRREDTYKILAKFLGTSDPERWRNRGITERTCRPNLSLLRAPFRP